MSETHWPDVLADLTAKRDALDQVIETIRTQFMNGNLSAEKPRKRTNERTNEQSARQRRRRIGASLT